MTLSAARPEPKPFNFGKIVNTVANKVTDVASDKGSCLMKKGIPQSLLKKAVACSPSAFIGAGTYAVCAGLSSINDAKKAVTCFTG